MNTPMITWFCIVGLLVVVVMVRVIYNLSHNYHSHTQTGAHAHVHARHHHLIEMGDERDEFFIPGDPMRNDRNSRIPTVNGEDDD